MCRAKIWRVFDLLLSSLSNVSHILKWPQKAKIDPVGLQTRLKKEQQAISYIMASFAWLHWIWKWKEPQSEFERVHKGRGREKARGWPLRSDWVVRISPTASSRPLIQITRQRRLTDQEPLSETLPGQWSIKVPNRSSILSTLLGPPPETSRREMNLNIRADEHS